MCGDPVIGVGVLLAMCGDPVLGGNVPLRGDSTLGKGVLLPVHGDPANAVHRPCGPGCMFIVILSFRNYYTIIVVPVLTRYMTKQQNFLKVLISSLK